MKCMRCGKETEALHHFIYIGLWLCSECREKWVQFFIENWGMESK